MANAFKSKRVSHASANTSQKVFEAVAANTLVKSIMAFDTAGATVTVYVKKVSSGEASTYAFEKIVLDPNVGQNLLLDILALEATDELWISSTTNTTVYLLNYVEEDSSVYGQSVKSLVDWSNIDPTNGQVPVWNATAGEYIPGDVAAGGAVTSVNGESGDVILDSTEIKRVGSTGDSIDTDLTAVENTITAIAARLTYTGTSTDVKVDANTKLTIDAATNKAVLTINGVSAGTFGSTQTLLPALRLGPTGSTYDLPASRGTTTGQVPVFNSVTNTTSFQALKVAELSGDSDDLTEGTTNLFLTSAERTAIAGIPSELDDLTDVVITDPLDHDSLVYDEVSTSWVNGAPKAVDMAVYSASGVSKGKVVKAIGSHGDKVSIGLFDLDVDDPKYILGVTGDDIAVGGIGHVRVYGELRDLSTDTYPVGTVLYASGTAGEFSSTPGTPEVPIAFVIRSQANTGRIYIRTWVPVSGVTSVNGLKGAVSIDSDDVPEGTTNLYHTTTRVQDVIDANFVVKSINSEFPDAGGDVALSSDYVPEGTVNLYHTDTRVNDLISAWADAPVTFGDTADAQGAISSLTAFDAKNRAPVRLREATVNGNNFIGLRAPAAVSADVTFTVPGTDGTAGQVLQTDGATTMSWVTKKLTQVSGKTVTSGSWSLVSGFYEATISDSAISASSVVDVIPDNDSIVTVKAAEILPRTDSSSGAVKIYAINAPTSSITVTLNIFDL